MIADMRVDLERGHLREQEILEKYFPKLELNATPENGIKSTDFRFVDSQELLELKSEDGYWFLPCNDTKPFPKEIVGNGKAIQKTVNLFMETWSNLNISCGGAWQACEKGAIYFTHYFPHNKFCIEMKALEIIEMLNQIAGNPAVRKCDIKNKTWTTQGLVVPYYILKQWYNSNPNKHLREFFL